MYPLKIVAVMGAIGAGKSTLLDALQKQVCSPRLRIQQEQVQAWVDEGWLDLFYRDPDRWSLTFQMRVLQHQLQSYQHMQEEANASTVPLMFIHERCPLDGLHIFATLQAECNWTLREFELYRFFHAHTAWQTDYVVWVRASEDTCVSRVSARHRTGEEDIHSYVRQVHQAYEQYFATHPPDLTLENDQPDAIHVGVQTLLAFLADKGLTSSA